MILFTILVKLGCLFAYSLLEDGTVLPFSFPWPQEEFVSPIVFRVTNSCASIQDLRRLCLGLVSTSLFVGLRKAVVAGGILFIFYSWVPTIPPLVSLRAFLAYEKTPGWIMCGICTFTS